jgi:hypothetical protein
MQLFFFFIIYFFWTFTVLLLFYIVSLLLNTLSPAVHKFSYTIARWVDCGANHAPLPSLHHHLQVSDSSRTSSRVQTEGARSGLYSGWSRASNLSSWGVSLVQAAEWGQALLYNKRTAFDNLPVLFLQIAGFSLLHSLSQFLTLVTVVPLSW